MSDTRKYGRLPRGFDPRVPHLSAVKMMPRIQLPALPPEVHNAAILPEFLGLMGNDRLGDCTIAALGHAVQLWTENARGAMVTPTDAAVEDAYRAVSGWDGGVGDPTDAGAQEQDVLTWATNTGLTLPDGSRTKLNAWVEIDPRIHSDVCEAVLECGLVYIGFSVPSDLPENAGSVWDMNVAGDPIGGHAVIVTGYSNPNNPVYDVISWGDRFTMTADFWYRHVDEVYGLFSPLWLKASGRTPWGLDAMTLEALMQAIRQA